MRAGRLRHRVTFQQRQATKNKYGEEITTWKHVAIIWAAVEPLKGREFFEAQRNNLESIVKVVIRYRPGIETTLRLEHNGINYDIQSIINPEMKNKELQLMCKAVQ